MDPPHPRCSLVVANRTASTPKLLEEIHRRHSAGSRQFLLLVPSVDKRKHPDWTPEIALRLLKRVAPHAQVHEIDPGADVMATIEQAVEEHEVDEVILSMVPMRLAKWLRRDLTHRIRRLGVAVVLIPPEVHSADAQRSMQAVEAGVRIGPLSSQ